MNLIFTLVRRAGTLFRVALILLPLFVASTALSQQGADTPSATTEAERNRETVRRAFDAWAAGESVFDRLLADDIVWTIHGSDPVAGTYTDRETFVEQAARPLVSRLRTPVKPKVHAIWAEGDIVIVRFDGSATTTSGGRYENQFVWIFQMENDVVTRAEAFLDLAAYRQVVENNPVRSE